MPDDQHPDIETFPNPNPGRDYTIDISCPEFTSVCPRTGQPDFGTIRITYVPDETCIELKALKMYLQAYRQQGIFYEAVTNRVRDDLVAALSPRWLQIITEWKGRGGIRSRIIAAEGDVPAAWQGGAGTGAGTGAGA